MDTRNFMYMFYGFLVVWLCLAAYVVSLAAREANIRRQLDSLRRLVEEREHKS